MKVLAIDYGSARTGVAVSDPSGTLARPLGIVEHVDRKAGLAELCAIIEAEQPELIVVGMPYTLRGEIGAQAQETEQFVARLTKRCRIPIQTADERYTTTIARARVVEARPRGSRGRTWSDDAQAATVLLQGVLDRRAGE